MSKKWIAVILGTVLLTVLTVQNTTVITIRLFFWSFGISQALMLFLTFITGSLTGMACMALRNRKKSGTD